MTRAGGTTPYGAPRFKLVWCESETMRDGGYFVKDGFEGYRDVPAFGGEQCWAILMWEPAHTFGTAWRWYHDHTDEITDLVTLGQYPYRGRYRLIKKLIHRELVNGELVTTRMEPTHFILDIMLPLIQAWNKLSNESRLKVFEEEIEEDEREKDRILADSLSSHHVNRSSPMVQKRVELMERTMAQAMDIARHSQKGMIQRGA